MSSSSSISSATPVSVHASSGMSSTHSIPDFVGRSGSIEDMSDKSPLDFFKLLVPNDILELVVDQTSLFAHQFFDKGNIPPHSRAHEWNRATFDVVELKIFVATLIGMGLVSLHRIEDHWSTSWLFASSNFSSIFKRNRFSLIMRFLHLNDSSNYVPKGQPGHDPLYKIRPFMEHLLERFRSSYNLGQEIAIDESMIGYKG